MASKYKSAVLGGTFDHFHKGHKKLLENGFSISERLIIGITSDKYVKKLKTQKSKVKNTDQNFQSFQTRKKEVENYLEKTANGRFEILEIEDLFGPTLDKNFQANVIIVSGDTKSGAKKINQERLRIGLPELKIFEIEPVIAEDGILLSSQRIRIGEIDREGMLYIKPQWLTQDLLIKESLKGVLRKPWGELAKGYSPKDFKGSSFVISVGDETTKVLNSLGVKPQISVIDFKIAREKRFSNIKDLGFSGSEKVYTVVSQAGMISGKLFKIGKEIFGNPHENRQIVLVEGEDDLSVLPLILASPLGVYIFYGQPQEGMVKILVTEEIKAKIREIVAEFNTRGY